MMEKVLENDNRRFLIHDIIKVKARMIRNRYNFHVSSCLRVYDVECELFEHRLSKHRAPNS